MSAVAHPAALGGPSDGGVAARRAIIRWAGRMLRREWRQQLLVVTLLTVAVAAAVGSITVAHNASPADNAEVGSANRIVTIDGTDPQDLAAALEVTRKEFGTIDVVGHRPVAVPGSVDPVDFRAQDPRGPYSSGLLSLRHGTYPAGPGQVAVTDGVAELLRLDIGSNLALDGQRRTVVGIVENPRKLSDEFALLAPSSMRAPLYVNVLVNDGDGSFESLMLPEDNHSLRGFTRPSNNQETTTLGMFSVATVFLLLASLVAAAGFAVVAQRRLRQLGMLAAIGATQKHIRLVLLANGALVGTIAALVGAIVGVGMWLVAAPILESATDHRIDRFSLPWGLLVLAVLMAILGASAAAWWPGRTVARLPVMLALSGRPAKPRPARHSALAAVALIVAGIVCLALSNRDNALLIVIGIAATIFGTLLLGPLAIRAFSGVAGHVAIAPRLALRDLVRYQARSGAALAAVTLALGIAAAIVLVLSAEEARRAAEWHTLSDRQVRVYLGPKDGRELTPVDAPARLGRLTASVREVAGALDDATVIPLHSVFRPDAAPFVVGDTRVFDSVILARRIGREYHGDSRLYVATPAVLRYLGIDPATIDPAADFLLDRSVRTRGLVVPGETFDDELPVENIQKIETGRHLFGADVEQTPPKFITLNGLRRQGWKQIPAGWLVESSRPLTGDQVASARDIAAEAGLGIEVDQGNVSFANVKSIATTAGAILALAILAMTVGLIRSESARDLRTLTATGATPGIRRTLTATTAGALALLGALLAVGGAYAVLTAIYLDDLGYLSNVPFLYLALGIVGVPLAAAAAGWLVAGREPPAIARQVIE
jgi:putative ABC transport system permease protein